MSETTEMMQDGTLCMECGAFLGPESGCVNFEIWEPAGYPQRCYDCQRDAAKTRKAKP